MIKTEIQIRFSDIDSFGHVNNTNLQHYYDYGKVVYFRDILKLYGVRCNPTLIIASSASNYFLPIFFNDAIEVETSVLKIGEKSITLFQQIIDTKTASVKSDCTVIMVAIDKNINCSIEIPEEWIEVICTHEEKDIDDLRKDKE